MTTKTPDAVAEQLIADAPSLEWLRALTDNLDREVRAAPLDRLRRLWGLSNAETGRMFGVSRQAFSKWLLNGVPAERTPAVADLAAATDILDGRVKRERIPAVVRRSAEMLGGESLYELACRGRHDEVLEMVREMFDLRRIQP